MKNQIGWRGLALLGVCLALWGCQEGASADVEVKFASAEEVDALWKQAESYEPVGEASVEELPDSTGVTVLCRQPFMLTGTAVGSGRSIAVRCCTGRCTAPEGVDPKDCTVSGCSTGGEECSALQCGGGCTVSQTCRTCPNETIIAF